MAFNFGNVTFSQGSPRVIGLPLDVIDKVGTTLTEKYYKNRQAASAIKQQALNLPDSNSPGNKKIVEEITNEVKSKFDQYQKEDNWSDADKAVFDTLDELTADARVRDLYKFNAQYAKVEKDIDDSKAPEYYKDLRRAKNNMLNQEGIRTKDGQVRSYTGQAISGDLNFASFYKTINDLVEGWKADSKSISQGGGQVTATGELSDGYKLLSEHFTKEKLSRIDENEVRSFISNYVMSDPNIMAQVNDMAELNLFAKTGKLEPTAEDVTALMSDMAVSNRDLLLGLVANSSKYQEAIKGKKPEEANKILQTLIANPEDVNIAMSQGIANLIQRSTNVFGKNSKAYQDAYTNLTFHQVLQGFDGLAGKVAYTDQEYESTYKLSSLNDSLHKVYMEKLTGSPFVYKSGQASKDNIVSFVKVKDDLETQIASARARLAAGPNEESKQELTRQIQQLEGLINANNRMLDQVKNSIGITDKKLIDQSKDVIIADIADILSYSDRKSASTLEKVKMSLFHQGFDNSIGKPRYYDSSLKPRYNKVYEGISKANSIEQIKEVFTNNNAEISDENAEFLLKHINKEINNNLTKEIEKNHKDIKVSLPIESIGWYGNDSQAIANVKAAVSDILLKGQGTARNLFSSNADEQGTIITNTSKYYRKEGKDGNEKPVLKEGFSIDPVMFAGNNTDKYMLPTFAVTYKEADGTTTSEIIQLDDMPEQLRDSYSSMIKDVATSYFNPKNAFPESSLKTGKTLAAFMGSGLPVSKIGGQIVSGQNFLSAQKLAKREDGIYEPVVLDFGNQKVTVTTAYDKYRNEYNFNAYLGEYPTITSIPSDPNIKLIKDYYGATPNEIFEVIGASTVRERYRYSDPTSFNNISKLFNLTNIK